MRRFRTESVSAEEMQELFVGFWRGFRDREMRLLLHWWAVGHDPRRHVLACEECEGKRYVVFCGDAVECEYCSSTGRRDRKL